MPLLAALQRSSCFGNCPVYSVRVYEDGTVIYLGEWHVRVRGGRREHLSPADLNELREAFRRSDFLGLKYECQFAHTDDSSARVFFAAGGKARLINHYHGCAGVPVGLTTLEDEIDRITGTSRWVGPSSAELGAVDLDAMEPPLTVPGVAVEPEERRPSKRPPNGHIR